MKNYLFVLTMSIAFAQPPATPAENILKSTKTINHLLSNSLVAHLPLTNIGPSVMSGRVSDLEVNPKAPHEFYVGYASGGLWYTNNNGTTFSPVMDNSPTQNIAISLYIGLHTRFTSVQVKTTHLVPPMQGLGS